MYNTAWWPLHGILLYKCNILTLIIYFSFPVIVSSLCSETFLNYISIPIQLLHLKWYNNIKNVIRPHFPSFTIERGIRKFLNRLYVKIVISFDLIASNDLVNRPFFASFTGFPSSTRGKYSNHYLYLCLAENYLRKYLLENLIKTLDIDMRFLWKTCLVFINLLMIFFLRKKSMSTWAWHLLFPFFINHTLVSLVLW